MTTSHTPGPWELVEVPDEKMISSWYIQIGTYKVSVFPYWYDRSPCGKFGGYRNDEEMMANARVLSAGADLLGALEKAVKCLIPSSDEYAEAQAAIAKALGAV